MALPVAIASASKTTISAVIFTVAPQAVNHEHERGAGRLIISRRRVVGRQSQHEQPLATHVRQKSPVSDFLGAFGYRSSRICAGCYMPATTRSRTWQSNARNGGKKTVPSGGQSGALASGLHSKRTRVASLAVVTLSPSRLDPAKAGSHRRRRRFRFMYVWVTADIAGPGAGYLATPPAGTERSRGTPGDASNGRVWEAVCGGGSSSRG
jgi:hypothetical protein